MPFGEAVCLIAEAYDEQSTVIIIPCSTNPLASRSRGNAATSCCSSPLLTTHGRAPPPAAPAPPPKAEAPLRPPPPEHTQHRGRTRKAEQQAQSRRERIASHHHFSGAGGHGQGYSPASSALRSAIPASCAPAAGAVALITAAVAVVRSPPRTADLASRIAARLPRRNGSDDQSTEPGGV